MEIPCEYRFKGYSFFITWLKNKLIEEEFLAEESEAYLQNDLFVFVFVILYFT